jgi:hypothetical protein
LRGYIAAHKQRKSIRFIDIAHLPFQQALPRASGIVAPAQRPMAPGVRDLDPAQPSDRQAEVGAVVMVKIVKLMVVSPQDLDDLPKSPRRNELAGRLIPVMPGIILDYRSVDLRG